MTTTKPHEPKKAFHNIAKPAKIIPLHSMEYDLLGDLDNLSDKEIEDYLKAVRQYEKLETLLNACE